MMSELRGFEPDCSFDEIVRREIEEAPILLEAHQRFPVLLPAFL